MMCRLKVISHNSRGVLGRWWGRGRGLESQMPLSPNYHLNLIILVNFLGIDNIINQILVYIFGREHIGIIVSL